VEIFFNRRSEPLWLSHPHACTFAFCLSFYFHHYSIPSLSLIRSSRFSAMALLEVLFHYLSILQSDKAKKQPLFFQKKKKKESTVINGVAILSSFL
jgi:hypothetical protein